MNKPITKSYFFNFSHQLFTTYTGVLSKKSFVGDLNSIAKELGLSKNNFAIPVQIHSNVVEFAGTPGVYSGADGLVTNNPKIILALKVADCVPVYLSDEKSSIFGLVHSGWKGTAGKIVNNAVKLMKENGSHPEDIKLFLGPAIGICCYEVGREVAESFHQSAKIRLKNNKWNAGLNEQIILDLCEGGIPETNIQKSEICTFESNDCHSYRRDGIKAGRMIALMGQFK